MPNRHAWGGLLPDFAFTETEISEKEGRDEAQISAAQLLRGAFLPPFFSSASGKQVARLSLETAA
jgi:hypothetical protein